MKNLTERIIDEVKRILGPEYEISLNKISKNNGLILDGLVIKHKNTNIAPTIYLNAFYELYANNRMNFDEITRQIIADYERNKIEIDFNVTDFMQYDKAKKNIVYKLINTDMNQELLKNIPYITYLDLSIVFMYVLLNNTETLEESTILIDNSHLKMWNVSNTELYEIAKINTPRIKKYKITNMNSVVGDIFPIPMYILNCNGNYGATSILYEDLLKDFSTASNSDLFLIPSSVHEWILIPTQNKADAQFIKEMIKEVNANEVAHHEVLSNSLYYYNREKDVVLIL